MKSHGIVVHSEITIGHSGGTTECLVASFPPPRTSATRKRSTKFFKYAGAPHVLHLIGLAKGMSFGSSHCGGLGFTQYSHTSTAISLSCKILYSTLNQGTSGISNSFSLGNLLTNASDNHSNKVLTTFLFTVEASILSLYVHAEGPY